MAPHMVTHGAGARKDGLSCPASSRADGTHGASTGGRVGDEESRPCLPRTPTHVAR